MRTMIVRQVFVGIACIFFVSGCANIPSQQASSSDNPPLPQPSGAKPVPPPSDSPPASSPVVEAKPDITPDSPAIATPGATAASTGGTTTAPPEAQTDTPADTGPHFDNLEVVDPGLNEKLNVSRVGSDTTQANLMTVFVGLRNRTAHDLNIEIQTIYKDKSDTPLSEGKASWIPMKLKPHQETEYRSVAISVEATDFLVRIRQASSP